ncbi:AraC family transcriptional regulator [Oceanicola sp. S124]|uniref:AraC family transcriptional regulator n=1 Tax=Oceanicola sp. S124 TaxID=1042378 RepID=UPI0002557A67|nr:AraC family transcriptional regulator [Oceanicola sp. S124]
MTASYEDRLLRVMDHIHANPGGDLSLDALAEVAAMSRFHWHRVFRAMTGETCAQAVRRIRMHLAACALAGGDDPVGQIARSVGYPDPDSFARTFAARYGHSPLRFRHEAPFRPKLETFRKDGTMTSAPAPYPIELRAAPARRLVGLPHRGSYFRISEAYSRLGPILSARGLWPQVGPMVALYYDDISAVPEAELRSFAAVQIPEDMPLPEGLEEERLEAAETVVLTFRGPYAGLHAAYQHLYETWLPASGREPLDQPPYEVYLNSPMDTAPDDLLTEISIALQS